MTGSAREAPRVAAIVVQSRESSVPLRMCCNWISASADSRRIEISTLLISRENIAAVI